jgi:ribosomal RNA-processing protein 12
MITQAVQYKKFGGDLEAKRQKMKPPLLSKILNQLERAMATQPLLLPYLLPILTALVSKMRSGIVEKEEKTDNSKSNSPAQILLLDAVISVADLRAQPGFQDKEKVDDVVGMAFEVMGVEAVLRSLPLNIEPDA